MCILVFVSVIIGKDVAKSLSYATAFPSKVNLTPLISIVLPGVAYKA